MTMNWRLLTLAGLVAVVSTYGFHLATEYPQHGMIISLSTGALWGGLTLALQSWVRNSRAWQ